MIAKICLMDIIVYILYWRAVLYKMNCFYSEIILQVKNFKSSQIMGPITHTISNEAIKVLRLNIFSKCELNVNIKGNIYL